MLGTPLNKLELSTEWCERLVFSHYQPPHSTTNHMAVMFQVIVLLFECHSCFVKSVLKMGNYIFWKFINVLLVLSKAHGDSATAVRLYTKRYPQCRLLNPHTFKICYITDCRNMKICTVRTPVVNCGRWRSAQTVDVEEHILKCIEENLHTSIRWTQAAALRCARNSMCFHLQWVETVSLLQSIWLSSISRIWIVAPSTIHPWSRLHKVHNTKFP
jgi:hypothetical protein